MVQWMMGKGKFYGRVWESNPEITKSTPPRSGRKGIPSQEHQGPAPTERCLPRCPRRKGIQGQQRRDAVSPEAPKIPKPSPAVKARCLPSTSKRREMPRPVKPRRVPSRTCEVPAAKERCLPRPSRRKGIQGQQHQNVVSPEVPKIPMLRTKAPPTGRTSTSNNRPSRGGGGNRGQPRQSTASSIPPHPDTPTDWRKPPPRSTRQQQRQNTAPPSFPGERESRISNAKALSPRKPLGPPYQS